MALIDPPELRRLTAFMDSLPKCPYGCHPSRVYETPTFRVPTVGDTIDDQVSEIIERLGPEVNERLRRHLAEDQERVHALSDFFAFLDEVRRDARAREAAYTAWLDAARPAVADHLTETLIPEGLRAAGIRFEWAESDG
ncbi:MAG: hypothetical protein HOY76_21440 [Streptomyces sp.]|nr:hypothetical protein [Streptomyces sp.]